MIVGGENTTGGGVVMCGGITGDFDDSVGGAGVVCFVFFCGGVVTAGGTTGETVIATEGVVVAAWGSVVGANATRMTIRLTRTTTRTNSTARIPFMYTAYTNPSY